MGMTERRCIKLPSLCLHIFFILDHLQIKKIVTMGNLSPSANGSQTAHAVETHILPAVNSPSLTPLCCFWCEKATHCHECLWHEIKFALSVYIYFITKIPGHCLLTSNPSNMSCRINASSSAVADIHRQLVIPTTLMELLSSLWWQYSNHQKTLWSPEGSTIVWKLRAGSLKFLFMFYLLTIDCCWCKCGIWCQSHIFTVGMILSAALPRCRQKK